MTAIRATAAILLPVLAAATLAGCTGTTDGNATPATSQTGAAASSTAAKDVFNGLQACQVLDNALQGEGFPAGHIDKSGGDNGCGSQKLGFGAVGLTLDPEQGIDALQSPRVYEGDVNGRPARRQLEGAYPTPAEGDCAIVMKVTSTSRATLNIASQLSTDEACDFVTKIAERIDPQLPPVQE